MPEDRHHHLATRDDATEIPAAPRADPLSSHTHVQHSCDPVRSGVMKGLGLAHRDEFRCILKSRKRRTPAATIVCRGDFTLDADSSRSSGRCCDPGRPIPCHHAGDFDRRSH